MYSQNKAKLLDIIRAAAVIAVAIAGCLFMIAANAETIGFVDNPFIDIDPSNTTAPSAGAIRANTERVKASIPEPKTLTLFAIPSSTVSAFGDDRADRLDAYFTKYKMPLAGHGQKFIEVADNCGLDWQLLPAIAVKESSGGKRMRLNNPFGWASAKIGFNSLDDAIERVGEHLCGLHPNTAKYYKDKTTYQKLYAYNGTVIASYPKEVVWIMTLF